MMDVKYAVEIRVEDVSDDFFDPVHPLYVDVADFIHMVVPRHRDSDCAESGIGHGSYQLAGHTRLSP